MVNIEKGQEFTGAVSGADAGEFVENYFVSDTLTGINGRSYTGRAEPISYEALLNLAGTEDAEEKLTIPEEFLQLTLTFSADDAVIERIPFDYRASFDETIYPEIPEKEGYYACWDKMELTELHFDTVVTAVYTPYVSVLSNTENRSNGKPIFFVEGQFDDGAAAEVAALPNTPDDFDILAEDWKDFLIKSFSGRNVSREIVEQWRISIPDDGHQTHAIRYLAPDGNPKNLDIYVKEADGWKKADTETVGSYLVFSAEGLETEIAVISTTDVWWIWLIAGALVLLILLYVIRMIRKIARAKLRKAAKKAAESAEAELGEIKPPAAPKKKKRWLIPLLIIMALLVGIGGTAAFFLLPDLLDDVKAYDLMKKYLEKQAFSMELTVTAQIGSEDLDFTAEVGRAEFEGHRITAISQEERTLYYCDGAVFLENGNAYKLNSAFPDYSELLDQALDLYQYVDIEEKDGVYTITAENEDAKEVLELLLPSAAEILTENHTIRVELTAEEDEVSRLQFAGSGTLADEEKTDFQVNAVLDLKSGSEEMRQIPEAVKNAVINGEYKAGEEISDDLIRMANAWQTLNKGETVGAKLILKADCGPVTLDDRLDFYHWNKEGIQVSSIQKNGYAVYFTDTEICNQEGKTILASDASLIEAAKLLDIAYQACLNAEQSCSEADGKYTYTVSLDKDGMEAVAYAIAPAAEGMDLFLENGSLQIVIENDRIQSIEVYCSGNVQVVLSNAVVAFEARMEFAEDMAAETIPKAVKNTLEK